MTEDEKLQNKILIQLEEVKKVIGNIVEAIALYIRK